MVKHSRLVGRVVRCSAYLKGDALYETTQDWWRVTVQAEPPKICDHVEVGFGQGGRRVVLG